MARTWGYTRRNRLPLRAIDAVGGRIARSWKRSDDVPTGPAAQIRRILVVEFWNIGDVVLATPFLAALREIFPAASVTLLGQKHAAEVLANSDLVDDVVTIDIPWTAARRRYDPRRYRDAALRHAFRALRSRRFDIAFESRMDPRAKLVLALSGARRRVAYDYGGCNWLLTDAVPVRGFDRHRVDDWAALLEPFGGAGELRMPRLAVTAAESAWAEEWLRSRGIRADDRVVAIHPGASSAIKRWPLERFERVAGELAAWPGVRVVIVEDPAGYGAGLSRVAGVEVVRPTLRQLLALLAEVDVLVGNDSGPMHLAAAVGTPTVGVFHPHAAREFAPRGASHHVLTAPGAGVGAGARPEAAALLGVPVDAVVSAAGVVLSRTAMRRCATGS